MPTDVLSPERPTTPINDLASGQALLEQLPLGQPTLAEAELAKIIDNLRASPPPLETYLTLLEQARLPLQFITEDMARCYIGKSLPLGENEEAVFHRTIAAWRRIARAYDHCAQFDTTEDTPDHAARVALVLHRCISYMGTAIIEHYRARREIPPGLWLELHGYYDSAEEWRVASVPVVDTLDPQQRNSTCMSMYAMLLLIDMANPYGLGVRDQGIVRRWACNWAPLVEIKSISKVGARPEYVIDLIQDTGLYPASFDSEPTASQRYLETSRLTTVLVQARQQLKERVNPAQIGLGEDCTPNQAMRLLLAVNKPWSQATTPRRFRRHSATGKVKVSIGFDNVYYQVNGREFGQPQKRNPIFKQLEQGKVTTMSVSVSEQGLQVTRPNQGENDKYGSDDWDMVNQSANGFRIVRTKAGTKMEHGQLLALCPYSGARFLLGQVTWLMQEDKSRLAAGIAILPGLPQAVAVRPIAETGLGTSPYSRAFLLPKVDAVNDEDSLVLPPGWFQRGRIVEVFTDHAFHVRLTRVHKRGIDFERIGFEAAL